MIKTIILAGAIVLCGQLTAKAQYSINKLKYNSSEYIYQENDRYNPDLCGVTSAFFPGGGHFLANEPGRGFAFLGGEFASLIIVLAGVSLYDLSMPYENRDNTASYTLIAAGCISTITIRVYDIINAVEVAKINNLAHRDKNKTGYHLKLQPCFITSNAPSSFVSTGVALKINF